MAGLIKRRKLRRKLLQWGSVWAGSLLLATCDQGPRSEELSVAQTFRLTSPAFSSNALIPPEFTCDGINHSPPMSWEAPPPETQSLVLLMEDPDAPNGTFVHWVIYDLPPDLRGLPKAIPAQPFLSQGGIQGKNDFGQYGYGGPCPPSGIHQYWFRLYAVDKLLDLPPGVAYPAVQTALKDHILAGAELMGRYDRQR
jgi:Raf kinase inhibitor-like YbhB/YbcL family protein